MRVELYIFFITAFLIYNSYNDDKYTKRLMSYTKYYKIVGIAIGAMFVYGMIKKNPDKSKNLLFYANNMARFMPIDKSASEMLKHTVFDFTTPPAAHPPPMSPQMQMPMQPQMRPVKRAVSETKKKLIAYNQGWKCGHCQNVLTHTFEVDHIVRLEHGGGNDPQNLVALCRECHGQKTAMENM